MRQHGATVHFFVFSHKKLRHTAGCFSLSGIYSFWIVKNVWQLRHFSNFEQMSPCVLFHYPASAKKYPTARATHCWNAGFSCLSSSCTPSHIPPTSGCSQGRKISSSSYLPNSGWYLLYVGCALCFPKHNQARAMFCCNWKLTVTWKQIQYIFNYLCNFSCRHMTTFNLILYLSLQYSLCHTSRCRESAYRFIF